MTFEDPFFVVKEEVSKALNKTRGLYRRWLELQEDIVNNITKDELEWTTTELRNALRSIEWDLEDLDDTIGIVEKNPTKFKIDNKELTSRKNFIEQTREEVKCMKEKMNFSRGRDRDRTARQPLLENSPVRMATSHGTTKYSKLENEMDSPHRHFLDSTLGQQNQLIHSQDDQLEHISHSIGSLKTVSRQIGSELDEQAVMLDDFGTEMENTESKLDSTMKKVAKVLHISNGMALLALVRSLRHFSPRSLLYSKEKSYTSIKDAVQCICNSSVRNFYQDFFKVSRKSSEKLKISDKVPHDYSLIYVTPLDNFLKFCYPAILLCAVAGPCTIFYGLYIQEKPASKESTKKVRKIHINSDFEKWIFLGAIFVFTITSCAVMFKAPFRIYKHEVEQKYIAIFLSPIPLISKQFFFKTALETKFKNPLYMFFKECQFLLDKKKKVIMFPYCFRTPVDFLDMVGQD